MPNAVKWSAVSSAVTALSTELDSLGDGSYSAAGSVVDNASEHNVYGDFELHVSFGSAPSGDGFISLYLLTALDGTNYQDGGGSVAPPHTAWRGNFPLRAVTDAQRVHLHGIVLPPSKFKAVIRNSSGQAFPSSGSTVKLYTYNEEVQ